MVKLIDEYAHKHIASLEEGEEKIEATKDKEKALSTWRDYETHLNERGIEEITIPPEYTAIIQPLINAFMVEDFPNGNDLKDRLSDATENALASFREKILPEEPIKVDYLDPELLLYAAYKAYDDHFDQFQDWEQRSHFVVKVIGFSQSILSPETAKVFCQGLYHVVERGEAIGEQAAALKLPGGEPFYRGSREFTAEFHHREQAFPSVGWWGWGGSGGRHCVWKTLSSKSNRLSGLMQKQQQPRNLHIADEVSLSLIV